MARHLDTYAAGRSRRVPFIPGENPADRHERRKAAALRDRVKVQQWCDRAGVRLRVSNEGHHWQFRRRGKLAEWWPSSAKLVWCKQWSGGVHVHDSDQLTRELGMGFGVQ